MVCIRHIFGSSEQVRNVSDSLPQSGYVTQPRVAAPRGYPGIQRRNSSYPNGVVAVVQIFPYKSVGDTETHIFS